MSAGGKILLTCPCGEQFALTPGSHVNACPKCAASSGVTFGPDGSITIKAADGPGGASLHVSGNLRAGDARWSHGRTRCSACRAVVSECRCSDCRRTRVDHWIPFCASCMGRAT